MAEPVIIGDCQLWNADCRGLFDVASSCSTLLTDPPYGIGMDGGKVGKSETRKLDWDRERPSDDVLKYLGGFAASVIWGGNYFCDVLPPAGKWLVWDKRNDPTTFADCEMAWTNLPGATRMFRWLWSGPYMERREERFGHPAQKPLTLMEWCLDQIGKADAVFDPYLGTGTSGVACARKGISFIGVEADNQFFDIACKRIEKAYAQPDMFIERPAPPTQEAML